jgi:hypothetical protein
MLKFWEEMPIHFSTSASGKTGKEAILNYIEVINQTYKT